MANDFIGLDIKGIAELQAKLQKLVPEAKDIVTDDVFKYLLNVLKLYPPKKYVSRAKAYPDAIITFPSGKRLAGYQSIKQFHYVMKLVNEGKVPYTRTQGLSHGWQQIGRGYSSILANESPGAPFTMGDDTQSRHEKLVGWKTISQIIRERMGKILTTADGAIKKAIHKLGL